MAIGKKARDIFAPTAARPAVGIQTTPRVKGRPAAAEDYDKVTVCLFKRHVLLLDRVALAIREKTGRTIRQAELIRALIDQAADDLTPASPALKRRPGSCYKDPGNRARLPQGTTSPRGKGKGLGH